MTRNPQAVVTGASSGIGRAVALQLARSGADVLVHCRSRVAAAEAVAREIRELGRRSETVARDLADPAECEALCESAWQWSDGGVDVWVNCAGADVLTGEAAAWSFDRKLQLLWQVDVAGCLAVSRDIGRRMRQRHVDGAKAAVLINIGWDQSEWGMAGDSGEMFATVKGAVTAFSRSLARSLAPAVRVHCVAPGWIKTAWGRQASEAWQRRAVGESLLGRWGTPEDVAAAVDFLASPSAAFLTGVVLPVNGGFRTHE